MKTFVFGPNYIAAAAGMREGGVPDVSAARDAASFDSTPEEVGAVVIAFAHDVAPVWAGKSLDDWVQAMMRGTLMDMTALQNPDIRMLGNQENAAATLMLHWSSTDTAHAIKVMKALESSYAGWIG